MDRNKKRCPHCPFDPATRQASATDELILEARARIEQGEQWICHMSAGPGGSVNDQTAFCVSAPEPGTPAGDPS
jgi:hypothetical protein